MPVLYRKVQNKMSGSENYGKWYLQAVPHTDITTKDLANEISHATTVTYADILAVLIELSVAIRNHLLNSDTIHLEGLGTFRTGIRSKIAATRKEATANNIKATRILFRPESTFVPNGEVSEKGHRKGVYVKDLLQGITFKEASEIVASAADTSADKKQGNG